MKIVVPINQPKCYCPKITWINGEPYSEKEDVFQQANGVLVVRSIIYEKLDKEIQHGS